MQIPDLIHHYMKRPIVIIYTNNIIFSEYASILKYELSVRNIVVEEWFSFPDNTEDMKEMITLIMSSNLGTIIAIMSDSQFFNFLNIIGMSKSLPEFDILTLSNDIEMVNNTKLRKQLLNIYYFTNYLPSLSLDKYFEDIIRVRYPYREQIYTISARAYSSVMIFYEVYKEFPNVTVSEFMKNIYSRLFLTPLGEISLNPSNYFSLHHSLVKFTENKDGTLRINIIYSNNYTQNVMMYGIQYHNYYACSFDQVSSSATGETISPLIYFGIIFSVKKQLVEYNTMNSFLTSMHQMNLLGGIDGKFLAPFYFSGETAIEDPMINIPLLFFAFNLQESTKFSRLIYPKILFLVGKEQSFTKIINIFYLSPIPNQYIDTMYYYYNSGHINYFVVHVVDSHTPFYLLSRRSQELANNMVGQIVLDTREESKGAREAIVEKIMQRCLNINCAIHFFTSETDTIGILNSLKYELFDFNENVVVVFSLDPIIIKQHPYEFCNVFFSVFRNASIESNYYKLMNSYSVMEEISDDVISGFLGFEIWINIYKKLHTENNYLELMLDRIFQFSSTFNNQQYNFSESHFLHFPCYIYRFNDNQELESIWNVTYLIEPIYRYLIKNEKSYTSGLEQTMEYLTIPVFTSLTGKSKIMSFGLMELFQYLINKYNQMDEMHHKRIILFSLFDDKSDPDYLERIVSMIVAENTVKLLFLVVNRESTNRMISILANTDIVTFNTGSLPTLFCEKKIFFSGMSVTSLSQIFDIILMRLYSSYLILTEDEDSRNDLVKEYLVRKGAVVYQYHYSSDFNELSMSYLFHSAKLDFKSGCVLFFGNAKIHKLIDYSFISNNMESDNYHLISFSTGTDVIEDSTLSFEFVASYDNSNNSPESNEFKKEISNFINPKLVMTDIFVATYESLLLLLETQRRLEFKDPIIPSIYSSEIIGPVGTIYFYKNNYMSRIYSMHSYSSKSKTVSFIYSTENPSNTQAWGWKWGENKFTCDFTDESIGKKKKLTVYSLMYIGRFNGKYARSELQMLTALEMAVDTLNDEGGLFKTFIVIDVKNIENHLEEYIVYLNLAELNNYELVFGGYSAETLSFSSTHVSGIYSYSGYAIGDSCLSNSVVMSFTISQFFDHLRRIIVEANKPIYLISYDSVFSNGLKLILIQILSENHITLNGESDISSTSFEDIYSSIYSTLPDGALIFNTVWDDSSIEMVNSLCGFGIKAPKYTFLHVAIEESIIAQFNPKCTQGHYIVSSFFEDLNNIKEFQSNELTLFLKNIKKRLPSNSNVEFYMESIYVALKYWMDGIKFLSKLDLVEVKNYYYNRYYNSIIGPIALTENNYISSRVFTGVIDENNKVKIIYWFTDLISPILYSLTSEITTILNCNWSLISEKKIVKYIVCLHEHDINHRAIDYNTMIIENAILENLNSDWTIEQYSFQPIHYFYSVRNGVLLKSIRNIMITNSPQMVIGCFSAKCHNIISEAAETYGILFMSFAKTGDYLCKKFTLKMSPKLSDLYINSLEYLSQFDVKSIALINDIEYINPEYHQLFHDKLVERGIEISINCTIDVYSTISEMQMIQCIELINEKSNRTFLFVFNGLLGESSAAFNKLLFNRILNNNIRLLIYDYFSEYYKIGNNMNPHQLIISTFGNGNIKKYNELKDILQNRLTSSYGHSESLNYVTNAIELWVSGINYAFPSSISWPNPNYVRIAMLSLTTNSATGEIGLLSFNLMKQNIFIYDLTNNLLSQVYPLFPSVKSIEYYTLSKVEEKCNIGKEVRIFKIEKSYEISIIVIHFLIAFQCFLTLFLIFKFKEQSIIRYDSISFLGSIVLLMLASELASITNLFSGSTIICVLQVWLPTITRWLTICAKSTKVFNIYKLMNNQQLKKVKISSIKLACLIVILVVAAYLALWTGISLQK